MEGRTDSQGLGLAARIGLAVGASLIGLMLAIAVVVAQGPSFQLSKTGPLFADTGDIITYTILVVNSGDSATTATLSDTLPFGTTFVNCFYEKTGYTPVSPCTLPNPLWQESIDPGGRITTTLVVRVTGGTMNWPLVNCAQLGWDSVQQQTCFTTTLNPPHVYMPIVMRNFTPMPDLRVTSLTVDPPNPAAGDPVTITVVVENVGELPAGPFWVDFYDNPSPPPEAANQIWNFLCSGSLEDCYGIAWYVDDGLKPGESIVLRSLPGEYEGPQTHWPGKFVQSGSHDLYAFADAWNWGVWYGAVEERNEGLDNRYGPVSINVAPGTGGGALQTEEEVYIPWRPNHP